MIGPALTSAVVSAVSLMGGVGVGVALATLIDHLPFHTPEQTLLLLVMIPIFGGGALWGCLLARIHGLPNRIGVSLAGSLSFGLSVVGAATLLLRLERILIQQHHLSGVPVHVIFTLLFVPATFLVATIGSSAILLVSGNRTNWPRVALMTGLTAAVSFLILDLTLDSVGMRVGAPRAVERFTMLTVAFLGSTAAAFSAGCILGRALSNAASQDSGPSAQSDKSQRLA